MTDRNKILMATEATKNGDVVHLTTETFDGEPDEDYKISLLGNSGVGKSALLTKFSNLPFSKEHIATIGIEFAIRRVIIENIHCKLQIIDLSGQERFKSILAGQIKGSHIQVLCYDITDRKSFEKLDFHLDTIRDNIDNPNIILIGNKCDLNDQRKVSLQEAQTFADTHHDIAHVFESSAKDGINVNLIFCLASLMAYDKMLEPEPDKKPVNISEFKELYGRSFNATIFAKGEQWHKKKNATMDDVYKYIEENKNNGKGKRTKMVVAELENPYQSNGGCNSGCNPW